MRLKNQVAIVTGAAAGIGRATAVLFASEGSRVAAVDLDAAALEEAAKEIRGQGGATRALVADVSQRADVERVVAAVLEEYGRIDILFNNAGIVIPGKIHETTEADWDRTMAVNVRSMYLFCHAVVPVFQRQGGGIILNTSSGVVLRSVTDRASYAASKGAVLALTRSMALDYVKDNIRVNCLCPGTIDTPSLQARLAAFPDPKEARQKFEARQPMGRFGTPEEVAQAALYLVSSEAKFLTGVALPIDGGFAL